MTGRETAPDGRVTWRSVTSKSVVASLLVALLLIATSLSAHWHSEGVARDACSICVAAHLTPLEPVAPSDFAPQPCVVLESAETALDMLARGFSHRPLGRAPPGNPVVRSIA